MEPKQSEKGGFSYFVSDEQLQVFQSLSHMQRLKWVDEVRRFTLLARTPETAQRQERLRQGKTILE